MPAAFAGLLPHLGRLGGSIGLAQAGKSLGPGAVGLGLAGASAAAFGYNYGYFVRKGYHDFKPSSSKSTSALAQSFNPIEQAAGMGQMAAEQRTGQAAGMGLETQEMGEQHLIHSKDGRRTITLEQKNKMSLSEWRQWFHGSYQAPRNKRR